MSLEKQAQISVVMPVYKEPLKWIQEAVDSILQQTYDSLEYIIVIDNPNRTDVCSWLAEKKDDRIIVHVNNQNQGLVKSLNRGLQLCHGEYIARMDADDVAMYYRFEEQLQYLREERCDLVGTNVIVIDMNGKEIGISNYPQTHEKLCRSLRSIHGGIPHPTWLAKKSIFQDLVGYRQIDLAEDYDFLCRFILKRYRLGLLALPCLKYRQNLNGISQNRKGRQKYITRIMAEQLTTGMIMDEQEIEERIKSSEDKIKLYEQFYQYTRYWRNVLDGKEALRLHRAASVKPGFIPMFISEFWRNHG